MKSLSKNMFYNCLMTVFNLIFPLLTAGYISRILGVEHLGQINYVQSIVLFIILFSSFGIPIYGIREIAKYRDDKKVESQIFSELFFIKLHTTIISIIVYIVIVIYLGEENYKLYLILGSLIFFNIFNLDWYYSGIEEYKFISIRNVAVKIIMFLIIVLIVKKRENYLIYAGLLTLAQGISNLLSFFNSRKYVRLKVRNLRIKKHMNKLKIFFLSSLVISVYNIVNTIILGHLSNAKEVAYFVRARQLQGIGIAVTGAIATVLIPRVTYYYNNNKKEYRKILKKSLNYNYILSLPVMFGLIALSKEINLFLGGSEFLPAAKALIILAPLVVIITVGTWNYYQIWIPSGMEKIGMYFQIVMAISSLLLNILLIPEYGYLGASISLLFSELIGTVCGLYYSNKKSSLVLITDSLWKYIVSSLLMVTLILIMKERINLFLIILLAIISYGISLVVMKEKIVFEILKKVKILK